MNVSILHHLLVFAVFFLSGSIFAVVFDALSVLKGGFLLNCLKDVLLWITITIVMFCLCLKLNDGEFRFFMFIATLLGALLYFKTISRYVILILAKLFFLLKKIIGFAVKILLMPLSFLARVLNKPFFVAITFTRKKILSIPKKINFRLKILKKFKR